MSRSKKTYGHKEPEPADGVRYLEVGNGLFATVDEDIWPLAKDYRWSLNKDGNPCIRYKLPGSFTHTSMLLKSLVTGKRPSCRISILKNLDGDPLNCRRSNISLMSIVESRAFNRKLRSLIRTPRRRLNQRLSRFPRSEIG